jgi:hypothetical protein
MKRNCRGKSTWERSPFRGRKTFLPGEKREFPPKHLASDGQSIRAPPRPHPLLPGFRRTKSPGEKLPTAERPGPYSRADKTPGCKRHAVACGSLFQGKEKRGNRADADMTVPGSVPCPRDRQERNRAHGQPYVPGDATSATSKATSSPRRTVPPLRTRQKMPFLGMMQSPVV